MFILLHTMISTKPSGGPCFSESETLKGGLPNEPNFFSWTVIWQNNAQNTFWKEIDNFGMPQCGSHELQYGWKGLF